MVSYVCMHPKADRQIYCMCKPRNRKMTKSFKNGAVLPNRLLLVAVNCIAAGSCLMSRLMMFMIVASARSRYESLKKHTQDELKHTIDAMLDTENKVEYLSIY